MRYECILIAPLFIGLRGPCGGPMCPCVHLLRYCLPNILSISLGSWAKKIPSQYPCSALPCLRTT